MHIKNNKQILNLLDIFLIFGIFFLPGFISQLQGNVGSPDTFNHLKNYPNLFISYFFRITFLIYFLFITNNHNYQEMLSVFHFRNIKITDVFKAILLVLCIFIILIISIMLFQFIMKLAKFDPIDLSHNFNWQFTNIELFPLVLIAMLFVGYWEELLFRVFFINKLQSFSLPLFFILPFTSLIFGLGHIYYGFLGFVITSFLGFVFSLIYIFSKKNYHLCALTHGFYNSFVTLIQYFLYINKDKIETLNHLYIDFF